MSVLRGCALAVALLIPAAIAPARAGEHFGIGVKAGTLGFGLDVTGRINARFGLRGSFNGASTSREFEDSGNTYDGDFQVGALGLLFDWHPLQGNFRLTAGLMKNRNRFDLTGQTADGIVIGSTVYSAAQVGAYRGQVRFKSTAPYVGIGYGSAAAGSKRFRFLLDVGVLHQGAGEVALSSSGIVSRQDLSQEEAQIEEEIKDYRFWPVIAAGFSFRI